MEIYDYISEIVSSDPIKIVFSNKTNKDYKYNKVKINFSKIKEKEIYQVEKYTDKQVFHENLDKAELNDTIIEIMECYKQMSAISKEFNYDLRISKKGKVFFSKHKQKNEVKIKETHNKKKNYILREGMIIPPLVDLGIFTKDGKVINSKYDKFKQINRFVEIIDDEIKKIEDKYRSRHDQVLHILDFGCGKSYLTFILYYYFTEIKKINVKITGLDLKKDVIENCNKVAENYGYNNLKFELGDINGYKYENNVDIVITLHACDKATDYALFNAIKWNARMIFSVPCCQHEINSTIKPSNLELITKYGIIKERVASLFTDAIRANILECMGYRTQLLEFIDIAHSPKNILIRAVKSSVTKEKKLKALKEIECMKKEFNFEQTLYSLLKDRLEELKK